MNMKNAQEKEINNGRVNIDKKVFVKTAKEKELLKKMKASYKKTNK